MALLMSVAAASLFGAAQENTMQTIAENGVLTVSSGGHVVFRYKYEGVPFKPYVAELYTPGGMNLLLDAPSDHLHHHGLMYAVKVDDVNFWEERDTPGSEVHRGFSDQRVEMRNGGSWSSFTEQVEWVAGDGKTPLLEETRTIQTPQPGQGQLTVLTWRSVFTVPEGKDKATLTGAHYHGLGMRFIESMNAHGKFFTAGNETSETVRGTEQLTPSAWCAYTVDAEGKPVTAAMFGHPDNVRSPALWFTMTEPFAYLSATLNLWKEPLDVVAGKPLDLRYAVALWDEKVDAATVEKAYQQWLEWAGEKKP